MLLLSMPIYEVPPDGDNVHRKEIPSSGNVHGIIGSILENDAKRMLAFIRGQIQEPFDEERIRLYELQSPVLEVVLRDLTHFWSGFSYVSSQFYPSVVDASKRLSGELPLFPPGFVEGQMNASEEERRRFAELVASTPQLKVRVSGEVIEALQKDSSGVSWLQEQVKAEFHNGGIELVGAEHAIIGAGRLFERLKR